jgi:hypothetical protein
MREPFMASRSTARIAIAAMLLGLLVLAGTTRPRSLDLSRFDLVFDERFTNLSVSSVGPGTTWIAHTPWGGDFGDAAFADPKPGFPFGVVDGVGRIEMRKTENGGWQSGLLTTVDPQGHGFALQYGYFEMRAKLPAGPGVWPAFWPIDKTPNPSFMYIEYVRAYAPRQGVAAGFGSAIFGGV